MKIAITGGTGFVGRNAAHALVETGHEVVLLARGVDRSDLAIRSMPSTTFCAASLANTDKLTEAFCGVDAVVHCAGINRETPHAGLQRVVKNLVDGLGRPQIDEVVCREIRIGAKGVAIGRRERIERMDPVSGGLAAKQAVKRGQHK